MSKLNDVLTGNIGEWSEPYVVLKLISDGVLRQADRNMTPSETEFAQIKKIIREDVVVERMTDGSATFSYSDAQGNWHEYFVPSGGCTVKKRKLLDEILKVKKSEGSFSLPEREQELRYLGFSDLKNPIPKGKKHIKRDLGLQIVDSRSGVSPTLGFSIKSELGAPPSLLNASDATNIVYRIYGITDAQMKEINNIDGRKKILDRGAKIAEYAEQIKFDHYCSDTFRDNLRLVDGDLPQMMADVTLEHYLNGKWALKDIVEDVSRTPRYADCDSIYCSVKIKRFLRACALGMVPTIQWNDYDDASGGYIVVLPDGELMALYLYNRSIFDSYLFEYTKFEHGSTDRHNYMTVYKDCDKYFIKLNLQIRFTR